MLLRGCVGARIWRSRPASVRRSRCSAMDRPRLLAALIDREHEAAIQKLLVEVDRAWW